MDTRTLKVLAGYNQRTNHEMNAMIRTIDTTQWNQAFGGYFNSVKSLCNHIYLCDFNWLKRFSRLREFQYIKKSFFVQDLRFGSTVFETIVEYESKRRELDEHICLFVEEITPHDIDQLLPYTDSHGKLYERIFGGLVLHMFNHQTHHRGMISIYLEEMKVKNDYSNLADMF